MSTKLIERPARTLDITPEAQITATVTRILEGWTPSFFSWGAHWETQDGYGDRYTVAWSAARRELELYRDCDGDLVEVLVFDGRISGTAATIGTLPRQLMSVFPEMFPAFVIGGAA